MPPWLTAHPIRLWTGAVVLGAVALVLLPVGSPTWAAVRVALMLATLVLTLRAVTTSSVESRKIWVSFTLCIAMLVVAGVVTAASSDTSSGGEPAFGTAGGSIYLLAHIPLLVGAWFILRVTRAYRSSPAVTDALIALAAGGLLATHFVLGPLEVLGNGGEVMWPYTALVIVDLLVLAIGVRISNSITRPAHTNTVLVTAAMFSIVVADLGAGLRAAWPSLNYASVLEVFALGYVAFLLFVGAAALWRQHNFFQRVDPIEGLVARWRTVVMFTFALGVALAVHLTAIPGGDQDDTTLDLILTAAIVVLIAVRTWLLITAFRRAIDSSQTLRDISLEVVTDPADLADRVPRWIAQLTGRDDLAARLTGTAVPAHATGRRVTSFPTGPSEKSPVLVLESARPLSTTDEATIAVFARFLGTSLERLRLSSELVEATTDQRLSMLLANAADAVLVVNRDLVVQYATPAFATLIAWDLHDPDDQIPMPVPLTDFLGSGDHHVAAGLIVRSEIGGRSAAEFDILGIDGQLRHVEGVATWHPSDNYFVITLRDITEHQRLRSQLIERAFYDQLTGLPNRELFRDRLRQAVHRRQRYGVEFAVMMVDLDDFKEVNDSLGHPSGDSLLAEVASRLTEMLRDSDTAARLGGDEFALLIDNVTDTDLVAAIADRLIARLQLPFTVAGREILPRASVGIAYGSCGTSSEELERNVDLALYRAKGNGKGQWAVYESELHDQALLRLSQVSDLHRALDQGEIEPWYQAIVDLRTNAIVGVESLARWRHPTRGLIGPEEFIRIAEESGQIVQLGQSILAQSLHDFSQWKSHLPSAASLRMSVNLSPREMTDPELADRIREALQRTGVDGRDVILEITEGVLLPGEGASRQQLKGLRALGIDLYIDDFGTGWSSLAYLRTLPVSGLKLAREFVEVLPLPSELRLVAAIHDLSANFALDDVVAEGIETEEQRSALIRAGYRLGQGYMLGMPMPAAAMESRLARSVIGDWREAPAPAELDLTTGRLSQ